MRPATPTAAPKARGFIIRKEYVDHFGPTPGCSKCRVVMQGDNSQPTLAHSAECRVLFGAKLRADPNLRKVVEASDERRDRFMAEESKEDRLHGAKVQRLKRKAEIGAPED